ncbi:MAG: sigma-70 family RNA polymerase sigma factor [Acidobacteria bacterium]|nr:sigma-70 family RNA polymerase sigma factor [Acidobacteriota bacterium]
MENALCLSDILAGGDHTLVAAYLKGNQVAFQTLVERYQRRLINYINLSVHDYELAVDLAQETFIRVYRHAESYEARYNFSTWLYRIATNLIIDEIRRRKRRNRFLFENFFFLLSRKELSNSLPDESRSPEKTYGRKEKLERIQNAIDSLPPKYRLAFVLKEIQDLPYEEISDILNISPGTVKSRIHRAKMLLREKLSGIL